MSPDRPVPPADGGRYVVVFDSPDARLRDEQAPDVLHAEGLSTETYFPRLGIAVVEADQGRLAGLDRRCAEQRIPLRYSPELTYYAISSPAAAELSPPYTDDDDQTWGLRAVGAAGSAPTGAGIRVAVLDTGFDLQHPDFAQRTVTAESFVEGEDAQDGHGHGTHCVGIACGLRRRPDGPGYGVAPEAEIFAAKVLGDEGSGSDTSILAGIDWALEHECAVISMSLGADVREVHPPYVAAGRRALELGSLIVTAAGNNARRSEGEPGFVGAPANSPTVMAVAAVDAQLQVADFSSRSTAEAGGAVNVAAPGVDVLSSWTGGGHRSISGTSMATPFVAGAAALRAETGVGGQELWDAVVATAAGLDQPEEDVGAGLVQAPQADEQDNDDEGGTGGDSGPGAEDR